MPRGSLPRHGFVDSATLTSWISSWASGDVISFKYETLATSSITRRVKRDQGSGLATRIALGCRRELLQQGQRIGLLGIAIMQAQKGFVDQRHHPARGF